MSATFELLRRSAALRDKYGEVCNAKLGPWLRDVANARVHGTIKCVPHEVLNEEREHLLPLPASYAGRSVRTGATPHEGVGATSRHTCPGMGTHIKCPLTSWGHALKDEVLARTERNRTMLIRLAGFPAIKTLDDFDLEFATGAPKA